MRVSTVSKSNSCSDHLDISSNTIALDSQEKKRLGNRRVTGKEQFYTPPIIAEQIFDVITGLVSDRNRTIIEPAGGSGNFIEAALSQSYKNIVSFDIEPYHDLVKKGDFLSQILDVDDAITVSNPPFGRNNSLSIPFFNHAARFSEYVIFIVPRSWRKWTVQNKLDQSFHLIRDDDLDINYVDVKGKCSYEKNSLRTCIQYWKRSRTSLRPIYKVEDKGIIQRCKHFEADASLTLFGFGCGTVKTDFPNKPNTTQMFLKLKHPRALEALQAVDFSRFYLNTAYTEALSLHEINYLLNEYIFGDPFFSGTEVIREAIR